MFLLRLRNCFQNAPERHPQESQASLAWSTIGTTSRIGILEDLYGQNARGG